MEALSTFDIWLIHANDWFACDVYRRDWVTASTYITMIETFDNIQDFVFNTLMLSTPLLIFAIGTVGLI